MKQLLITLALSSLLLSTENNTTQTIHGHTLPAEPDPKINNATLGGVDSNGNGVRDDVERAIYKKYDKKLHVVALMQEARFYQRTMVEPTSEAKIIQKDATRTIDCQIYLGRMDKQMGSMEWINEEKYLENLTFDTPNRMIKYLEYNKALSGGVYGSRRSDIALKSCSQEVKDTLKEMGL